MASSRPHSGEPAGFKSGWRVLAIDDDPLFLEVVRICLEKSGCTVRTEANPKAGLNRAIEGDYDLVLLDLMMPGMAGEEILSLMKPLSLRQRVVVVSGADEADARARSRDLGAAGFIRKPVDTRQFTSLLLDILQDRIREEESAVETEPAPADPLVTFVFGECRPTLGRRLGAAAILAGLVAVVILLVVA